MATRTASTPEPRAAMDPGPDPDAMIELDDLCFRYPEGDFELRVPKLEVRRGERVALVGPSGSGKTTLLHVIAGLATPERGSIRTAGVDLAGLDDARRRSFRIQHVGLVFQEFELLEYLSVLDNVLLPYRMHPALRLTPDVRERAHALATSVGIGEQLARRPAQLSHGERQRAAVCRALVVEPELLLADEPTGNLDPRNKGRVLDLLLAYSRERSATLLTVTHDHDLLDRFGRAIDVKTFQAGPLP
jgi:putative ABC transport system ATP-binding protein